MGTIKAYAKRQMNSAWENLKFIALFNPWMMIKRAEIVTIDTKLKFGEKKMPLDKSGSKASVGKNIKTEMKSGKPQKQAIAIALNTKRKATGEKKPKLKNPRNAPGLK